MKLLLGLLATLVVGNAFGDEVFYSVKCVGSEDNIEAKWVIGDKTSVTITSDNRVLLKGAGIDLKNEDRPAFKQCKKSWGHYCYECGSPLEGSQTCCGPHRRDWNVKVVRRTGGDVMYICGIGSQVESFANRKQWLGKIYSEFYDTMKKESVSKSECVIDEAG
jgi:hypothetical protein